MSVISKQMEGYLAGGSMIRRMFEAGLEMKKKYGQDAVCDFSIGNPDLAPPPEVAAELARLAQVASQPASLGYMPNAGFAWALDKLAAWLGAQQESPLTRSEVMLGCGAAGVFNAFLHSILEPGDEVLVMAPYFVEYGFYAANHGGVLKIVASNADFSPNFEAIEAAINPRTRAMIINSPNNPSGAVYSAQDLTRLAAILEKASKAHGRIIYLISDEPYRFLTYDGVLVPPVLPLSAHCVVVSSFSKNLCLAGERVGYLAISPALPDKEKLMAAVIMSNRILGFVNPPVVGQYLMAAALDASTAPYITTYTHRRNRLAQILGEAGYEFALPKGTFYFFPKAPGGDDKAFVEKLKEQRILSVPGSGFGCPGHFRLSFAVPDDVIERSAQGFKKAMGDASE